MNLNSFPNSKVEIQPPLEIDRAVDRLADLLAETQEVRELIRTAQDLRNDPELIRISLGIKDLRTVEGENKQPLLDALQKERENLPSVMQFRQAEVKLRTLFEMVDKLISDQAGMNFSENARGEYQLVEKVTQNTW